MNPILQAAIFVVVGTVIVTSLSMGVLLLAIRLQKDPQFAEETIPPLTEDRKRNRKLVTFEVDGKRVNLRIDISDAHATAAGTQRVGT